MALSGASTMIKSNSIPVLWTSHSSEKIVETIHTNTHTQTHTQRQFQGGISILKNIKEGAALYLEITWVGMFWGRAPSSRSGHGNLGEK